MILRPAEGQGKTVAEAIEAALEQLGLPADQAKIEVLEPGSRGFLGLGGRDALVRATPSLSPAEVVEHMVKAILKAGDFPVRVAVREQEGMVLAEIDGDALGDLIGRRGRTMDALQYLVQLACARMPDGPRNVVLDIGGYRQRRAEQVERLARQAADAARTTGGRVVLEPMPAAERRLVHLALQGVDGIETESEGQEPYRRIVVFSRPSGRGAGQ